MAEIITLDQVESSMYPCMLYYGGSGVGKTYFCATAGSRQFFINIGRGITTITTKEVKDKFFKGGMPLVTTITLDQQDYTKAFDDVSDVIDIALTKHTNKFDTLCIDDGTALKKFGHMKGLQLSSDLNRSQTLNTLKKTGNFVPGIQDYGMEMNLIDQFVEGTTDLCRANKKNLILTAHQRQEWKPVKDPISGKNKVGEYDLVKTRPGFTGRTFPDEITQYFDIIAYAEVIYSGVGPIRRILIDERADYVAKNRYPGKFKDAHIKNPNFLEILKLIRS